MDPSADKRTSKISSSIDLDKEGAQHGHLTVPFSRNESPWGSLVIPLSVFRNGEGPTALLVGGNHGDEYEGPTSLIKLIQKLDIERVQGCVIVMPALNYPALKSGTRLSPVDGGNMNRSFPGKADGTITEIIADYVTRFLLPSCDAVIDIHAGGNMMTFLPTSVIHRLENPGHMRRTIAAARAFGAPNCLVIEELDSAGMLDTEVENQGKIFISTELGGGGFTTPETVAIAERGIYNCLIHLGVLKDTIPLDTEETRFLETPDDAYIISNREGMIEYFVNPGAPVSHGEEIAAIYSVDAPTDLPEIYRAPIDGLVIHRHLSGRISRGDCLAVLATEINPATVQEWLSPDQ